MQPMSLLVSCRNLLSHLTISNVKSGEKSSSPALWQSHIFTTIKVNLSCVLVTPEFGDILATTDSLQLKVSAEILRFCSENVLLVWISMYFHVYVVHHQNYHDQRQYLCGKKEVSVWLEVDFRQAFGVKASPGKAGGVAPHEVSAKYFYL